MQAKNRDSTRFFGTFFRKIKSIDLLNSGCTTMGVGLVACRLSLGEWPPAASSER